VRDAFDPRKTFADMPVVAEKAVSATLATSTRSD